MMPDMAFYIHNLNTAIMKKLLFAFILLGAAYQLKAQQAPLKTPDNIRSLLDNAVTSAKAQADSWNHLKSALKLNDVVALNNGNPAFASINILRDHMPVIVTGGNSKMPVVKLAGYSKMPVMNFAPVDLERLNREKLAHQY